MYMLLACSSDCCLVGGTCGDAVFESCNGRWDYRTSCSPSYHVCCLPSDPTLPISATNPPDVRETTETSEGGRITGSGDDVTHPQLTGRYASSGVEVIL